jgi:2',3'-cyclic-nucleotide 2'-phosphodiesterase (5'-nucleotidase family)
MPLQLQLLVGVGFFMLLGCSSAPKKTESKIQIGQFLPYTVLYQSGRQGTFNPCAKCTTTPFGGLDREANAVEAIRSFSTSVVYADGGNLFVPENSTDADIEKYRSQSEQVLEAFNLMSLDVFAPGPTDWKLGKDHLKKLSKAAAFHFVSTNIMDENDRRIFPAFQLVQRAGVTFAFLSILPEGWYGKDVHATAVKSALNKWVWQASVRADFVIVLSQLGDAELDRQILDRYPQVKLVIGNDPRVHANSPTWVRGRLLVDGYRHGYYLGKLSFELKPPFFGFYSEKELLQSQESYSRLERELASESDVNQRSALQAKLLGAKQGHPRDKPSGGSRFVHELIPLDAERFGTPNEITALVEPGRAAQIPLSGVEPSEQELDESEL